MRKRRFSLTKEQAESVKLALRITLEQLKTIKTPDPYLAWHKAKMEELLSTLETYQWEVN